jgi:hypothetical protein
MNSVDQTLDQLDTTLDRAEELIRELPLSDARKRQLVSVLYDLWAEVEGDMDLRPADFG